MAQETLKLTMFGAFQVSWGEQELLIPTDKIRGLLAYLCLEPTRLHRRDELASLLWSSWPDKDARRNLRQSLYRLKGSFNKASPSLGDKLLQLSRQAVGLDAEQLSEAEVDVWRWQQCLGDGALDAMAASWSSGALQPLEEAIALYQGEFLAGLTIDGEAAFNEWVESQRSAFHHRHTGALAELARRHRSRSEYLRADQRLQQWLALEPWNEEAHRARMRVLAMSGQRSAALAQYNQCVAVLLEEFQADPTDETVALYEQIHYEEIDTKPLEPESTEGTSIPTELPLPRPHLCLGREDEIARLTGLLCDPQHRLVTVLGSGGSGKTTLCTELLHELPSGAFCDGLYVIPLAHITRVEQLPSALAQSLGLTAHAKGDIIQRCCDYLRHKRALLLWDNFEQLIQGSDVITTLLDAAPAVSHLITSRVPLGLRQEQRFPIDGLSHEQATKLFVHCATKVEPYFQRDDEADAIDAICALVAGLPLAIELAASWVQMMGCEEIHEELQRDLELLNTEWADFPEHHRSMQRVFDQTWALLDPPLQKAFASLSIFQGSFDLKAARAVTSLPLSVCMALWERGLLQQPKKGRFRLQQLLHHFARQKLEHSFESQDFETRHTAYYLGLVREYGEGFVGPHPHRTKRLLAMELDNIRAAWQRGCQHHDIDALVMAASNLSQLYEMMGLLTESKEMFAQAQEACLQSGGTLLQRARLTLPWAFALVHLGQHERAAAVIAEVKDAVPLTEDLALQCELLLAHSHIISGAYPEATEALERVNASFASMSRPHWTVLRDHSDALCQLGRISWRQGAYARAIEQLEHGLKHDRAIGYRDGIAQKLSLLGMVRQTQEPPQQCLPDLEQALRIVQDTENPVAEARYLNNIGVTMRRMDRLDEAQEHYQRAYALFRELGMPISASSCYFNVGNIHWYRGQLDEALACFREVLSIQRELGEDSKRGMTLGNMGKVYKEQGRYRQAIDSLEQALALERQIGHLKEAARILGILGEVYILSQEPNKAIDHLEEGIAQLRELDYKPHLCWELATYSQLLHELGREEEATLHNEEALHIALEIDRKDIIEQCQQLRAAYVD